MDRVKGSAFRKVPKSALEEELEESSVTDLRRDLLPTIERMQKNPSLRVLIRKHGELRAVLMSAQTYDVFKKLVTNIVQRTDAMSREAKIESAFQRLQDERPPAERETTAVSTTGFRPVVRQSLRRNVEARALLGEIEEKLRELDTALEI